MNRFFPSDTLRGRLICLLVAVTLPLAVVAGVLARQNDRMAANRPLQLAEAGLAVAAARHDALIEGVRSTLEALARMPAISGAGCQTTLGVVLGARSDRYLQLAVFGDDGRIRCAVGSPGEVALAAAGWHAALQAGGHFAVDALPPGNADHAAFLMATYPLLTGGQVVGGLIATLRPQPVANPDHGVATRVWLLDDTGAPLTPGDAGGALPESSQLMALIASPYGAWLGRTRAAQPAAYAIRTVSPGLHLLSGIVGDDAVPRRLLLADPFAVIAGVCLLALVLMTAGAEWIVVRPLKHLNRAVGRWRGGGPVDPGHLRFMPAELRDLSLSFVQATAALAERETQLRTAIAQQDLLMQEIHHRVKNNLQIVASLLNLQAARIRQPEARAEFQSARDRVRALATLHRHLYAHGELHTINMRSFLNELCGQLLQGFGEEVGRRIHLDIEAPELQMSSDQAVPIALIVTETVSNSVKHAFPAGRSGCIRVCLEASGEAARLIIADDGVGMPPGSPDPAGTGRDGLGLHLIRGFARQLDATLTVAESRGTRYEFDMKVRRARAIDAPAGAGTGIDVTPAA